MGATSEQLAPASTNVPAPRAHGVERTEKGSAVHFGIALWPYDLLLRFGYDLPENEYMWEGEWFDDHFEAAALRLRSNAAKLVIAVQEMAAAVTRLEAAGAGETPVRDLTDLRRQVERAPLSVDLVASYLRSILDDIAVIVPCCFGQEGKPLADARGSVPELARSPVLAELDGELAELLQHAPIPLVQSNRPDFYVISDNQGFNSALPKAATRALRTSAALTVGAAGSVTDLLAESCQWFDALFDRLQQIVSTRAEDGPDLLERWAERDWSVILATKGADPALDAHFPAIS